METREQLLNVAQQRVAAGAPLSKDQKLLLAQDQVQDLKNSYQSTFGRGVGAVVLKDLEAQFDTPLLVAGDPYLTHARVGALGVLTYIRELMKEND